VLALTPGGERVEAWRHARCGKLALRPNGQANPPRKCALCDAPAPAPPRAR